MKSMTSGKHGVAYRAAPTVSPSLGTAAEQSGSEGLGRTAADSAGLVHHENLTTFARAPKRNVRSAPSRKDIRAEVCERAAGLCESCGKWVGESGESAHLDHRFGRGAGRPAESVENCWLLCIACDHSRTTNSPSAAYWWGRFILHAQRYGFTAEAQLADTKLEALKAKGLVAP